MFRHSVIFYDRMVPNLWKSPRFQNHHLLTHLFHRLALPRDLVTLDVRGPTLPLALVTLRVLDRAAVRTLDHPVDEITPDPIPGRNRIHRPAGPITSAMITTTISTATTIVTTAAIEVPVSLSFSLDIFVYYFVFNFKYQTFLLLLMHFVF